MQKFYYPLLIVFLCCSSTSAQFGYYFSRYETLPDTTISAGPTSLFIPFNKEDVKAIGMGKTQLANGRDFNAMMYNPALLAKSRTLIDGISIQAGFPPESYHAALFLKDHMSEFRDALSLKAVWKGVNDFKTAQDVQQQLAALQEIQDGLRFPRDLLNQVIGSSDDPRTHGVRVIPSISFQTGNFGFSLYGIGQSGFQVQQSPIVDALLAIKLPQDLNDNEQLQNAILSLQGILQQVFNSNEFKDIEALPVAYSFSYIDVVGAAGYGFNVTDNFSLGANLIVIHRRFSAKRILVSGYDKVFSEAFKDLTNSVTGFTFDVGMLYKSDWGTQFGLSLQNIIPVQKITSKMSTSFAYSYNDYDRDAFGNVIVQNGDIALVNYSGTVNVNIPFALRVPFIMNFGTLHPINRDWDIAFDWVDIAEQDNRYQKTVNRFRLGSEYRYAVSTDNFEIIPRIGLADRHLTYGLGLNLFRALQLDGAYAFDSFIEEYSYFLQLRIGW